DLRRPRAHPARPGRGDPAHRRDAPAGHRRGRGLRHDRGRLPGPSLRHGRPAGVPQGGRPAGGRAPRAGGGLPRVAGGLRGRAGGPGAVITVREHLERVLAQVAPGPAVRLPLEQAIGLVLAQDVRSPVDLPRFDNSAMDGYAVRAEDVAAADPEEPLLLPVLGDIPAGAGEPRRLRPGTGWRIMTGAPVPEGADAVVPVEDTDGHPREVQVRRPAAPGRHIRRAGEDLRAGQVIVPRGTRIGPPQVAALASAGVSTVRVIAP